MSLITLSEDTLSELKAEFDDRMKNANFYINFDLECSSAYFVKQYSSEIKHGILQGNNWELMDQLWEDYGEYVREDVSHEMDTEIWRPMIEKHGEEIVDEFKQAEWNHIDTQEGKYIETPNLIEEIGDQIGYLRAYVLLKPGYNEAYLEAGCLQSDQDAYNHRDALLDLCNVLDVQPQALAREAGLGPYCISSRNQHWFSNGSVEDKTNPAVDVDDLVKLLKEGSTYLNNQLLIAFSLDATTLFKRGFDLKLLRIPKGSPIILWAPMIGGGAAEEIELKRDLVVAVNEQDNPTAHPCPMFELLLDEPDCGYWGYRPEGCYSSSYRGSEDAATMFFHPKKERSGLSKIELTNPIDGLKEVEGRVLAKKGNATLYKLTRIYRPHKYVIEVKDYPKEGSTYTRVASDITEYYHSPVYWDSDDFRCLVLNEEQAIKDKKAK